MKITVLLTSAVLTLGACAGTVEDMSEETATYRGRTLHCMVDGEQSQSPLVSCDFERFYQENPDLVPTQPPSPLPITTPSAQ